MTEKDDMLIKSITQTLDKQTHQIDAETLQRIGTARREALAQLSETGHAFRRWGWMAGGAVALTCSILIISAVIFRPGTSLEFSPQGLELELMASQDDLEFYEELEFYRWLEQMEETG